ncbi:hypothetical protein BsWGS_22540 [Bradybaena similaris]
MYWKFGGIFNYSNLKTNSSDGDSTVLDYLPASLLNLIGFGNKGPDAAWNETETTSETQSDGRLNNSNAAKRSAVNRELTRRRGSDHTETTNKAANKSPENLQPFKQIDDKNAWVYSAYYDDVAAGQGKPSVHLFGLIAGSLIRSIYCTFSFSNSSLEVNGTAGCLTGCNSNTHIASHVVCPLPANARPTHVSLSYNPKNQPNNRLQIIYPGNLTRNFTVCYSVLHSNYNNAALLLQSIEMNRILGAEHFMVYNYSISPAVSQILQRYQKDGLVTVLPWPLPTRQIFYYGQLAALSDCSYRNRRISRFIVVVDTDEFIIPRNSLSWMQLIDSISPQERDVSTFMHPSDPSKKGSKTTGSFEFKSSFFSNDFTPNWTALPSQFPFSDEERKDILKFKFRTLSQFWRTHVLPPRHRSKYIARPELVYIAGVHWVQVPTVHMKGFVVNEYQALIHHFKKTSLNFTVMDTNILKFKKLLYPRLVEQYKRFPSIFM